MGGGGGGGGQVLLKKGKTDILGIARYQYHCVQLQELEYFYLKMREKASFQSNLETVMNSNTHNLPED